MLGVWCWEEGGRVLVKGRGEREGREGYLEMDIRMADWGYEFDGGRSEGVGFGDVDGEVPEAVCKVGGFFLVSLGRSNQTFFG